MRISDLPSAGPLQGNETLLTLQRGLPASVQLSDALALARPWTLPLRATYGPADFLVLMGSDGVPFRVPVSSIPTG